MALMVRSDDPALRFLSAPNGEPTLSNLANFLRTVGEITMVPKLPNGRDFPGCVSFHPTQILPKSMDYISYNGLMDRVADILVNRDVDAADAFRVAVLGDDWELRYEYLEDGCHLQGRCTWKPGSPWIDTGVAPEDEALASLSFTCQMLVEAQAMRFDGMCEFTTWLDEQRAVSADMAMRLLPYRVLDIDRVRTIEWILCNGAMGAATGCLQDLPGDWAVDALKWEPGVSEGAGLWTCRVVRRKGDKTKQVDMEVTCKPKSDPVQAVLTCALLAEQEISQKRREVRIRAFKDRFHVAQLGSLALVMPK